MFDPRKSKYDDKTLKAMLTNAPLMSRIHAENPVEYRELIALGAEQLGIGSANNYFVKERDSQPAVRDGLKTSEQLACLQEWSQERCEQLFRNNASKNPIAANLTAGFLAKSDPAAYRRATIAAQARGFNVVPAAVRHEEKHEAPTDDSIEFSPELCLAMGYPAKTRAANIGEWSKAVMDYNVKQNAAREAAAAKEAA